MPGYLRARIAAILSVSFLAASPSAASENDRLWGALKSGDHVAIIRHANAPGYGDPENFDVNNCATQRNLDDAGREQSRAIGKLFRANGIAKAAIYSSQWCRCLETARLMDLGSVSDLKMLNSFFDHRDQKDAQTDALRAWIGTAPLTPPTVLVTHHVNIGALTGYAPSSGEIVFLKRGPDRRLSVIGTIKTLR